MSDIERFTKELEKLINRESQENGSNTPDFILAMFLGNCLKAWNEAVQQRETWYGRDDRPSLKDAHQTKDQHPTHKLDVERDRLAKQFNEGNPVIKPSPAR